MQLLQYWLIHNNYLLILDKWASFVARCSCQNNSNRGNLFPLIKNTNRIVQNKWLLVVHLLIFFVTQAVKQLLILFFYYSQPSGAGSNRLTGHRHEDLLRPLLPRGTMMAGPAACRWARLHPRLCMAACLLHMSWSLYIWGSLHFIINLEWNLPWLSPHINVSDTKYWGSSTSHLDILFDIDKWLADPG